MAAHRRRQLDGQMTEAADAHHTDTVSGPNAVLGQDGPHRCAGAHQGRRVGWVVSIWDGHDAAGIPDNALAEGAQIVIVRAVLLLVLAVLVPSW